MDKQDELAALIHEAHRAAPYPWWHTDADKCRMAQHIAAAVRSFMGSGEAVDRIAAAIVKKADGCDWANMTERARDCERDVARAALSAAIGEEVGVGESEGGEPTGNSLS